jgi:hypothetical protein
MVGLGSTCPVDWVPHNHYERSSVRRCRPGAPLRRRVALNDGGVPLLPFSEFKGMGLGAR